MNIIRRFVFQGQMLRPDAVNSIAGFQCISSHTGYAQKYLQEKARIDMTWREKFAP
jgi:hypothetical protein